jgi:hypothetical protein
MKRYFRPFFFPLVLIISAFSHQSYSPPKMETFINAYKSTKGLPLDANTEDIQNALLAKAIMQDVYPLLKGTASWAKGTAYPWAKGTAYPWIKGTAYPWIKNKIWPPESNQNNQFAAEQEPINEFLLPENLNNGNANQNNVEEIIIEPNPIGLNYDQTNGNQNAEEEYYSMDGGDLNNIENVNDPLNQTLLPNQNENINGGYAKDGEYEYNYAAAPPQDFHEFEWETKNRKGNSIQNDTGSTNDSSYDNDSNDSSYDNDSNDGYAPIDMKDYLLFS